jgi:hypothetical protein
VFEVETIIMANHEVLKQAGGYSESDVETMVVA